jgi:hypothetical protein
MKKFAPRSENACKPASDVDNMSEFSDTSINKIADSCASTPVTDGHRLLLQKVARMLPDLDFHHVLTRGGWHRIGGIVDGEGERISHALREWLENMSGGDIQSLFEEYGDAGYVATCLQGKTHYFIAQTGNGAGDFVQLEVEELQEVTDRLLLDENNLPDDMDDLTDPLDVEKLSAEPLGDPLYKLRKVTDIADFLQAMAKYAEGKGGRTMNLRRFMDDWEHSSAGENTPFCEHWVLSLREYTDAWGDTVLQAKPITTFSDNPSLMKLNGEHRGSRLAKLIHGFDHQIGYPMAWYFFMLSHREVPHQLAEAIHADQMGAYDYLPARDLKILKDWSAKPYGI